jgi:hypothetical protein
MLYWQRECLRYTQPADTIIYDEDPRSAAALLAHAQEYTAYPIHRGNGPNGSVPTVNAAAAQARCLTQFISLPPPNAPNLCACGFGGGPVAVAFMHERISPAGHRRLVVVHYFPERDTFTAGFIEGYNYSTTAITPGTILDAPTVAQRMYVIDVMSSWPRLPPLVRMYAGQPDPADASHFTIRYQMWGQEDVLDGRLKDDDSVTLTPRHTPSGR